MSHYDSSFKFQYEACFTGLLARKMFDRHFINPTGEMTVLQQCDKELERYNLQLLKVPQAHSEG